MINLEMFENLSSTLLSSFDDKPTTLTPGQKEASKMLWTSADGTTKIGVWEGTLGRFTADRTAAGEYCHVISGRATVSDADGGNPRDIGPGDLLILPQGWIGEWVIHEQVRKLFVIDSSSPE